MTVINEKIYRNGQFTVRVPLKALIAASNELPAKGEGLEALYDCFRSASLSDALNRNMLSTR